MHAIRVMTYQVNGCRGSDGSIDPERVLGVIADAAPDVVAIQGVDLEDGCDHLDYLARGLGMSCFGPREQGANGYLSYLPMQGLRHFSLGSEGRCLRADVELQGKRLQLFNVALSARPRQRREQIATLLGPDLLGGDSLNCPSLILGDFADCGWGAGNINLSLTLRRGRRPLWPGTFPAQLPLFGRDRAYLCGELRILEASIPLLGAARRASSHLPLILTVQVNDPRRFLRADEIPARGMEIAPG